MLYYSNENKKSRNISGYKMKINHKEIDKWSCYVYTEHHIEPKLPIPSFKLRKIGERFIPNESIYAFCIFDYFSLQNIYFNKKDIK